MRRLLMLILLAVPALSSSDEPIVIEAEDMIAFHDIGAYAIVFASCSSASGGYLVQGVDISGEWIEVESIFLEAIQAGIQIAFQGYTDVADADLSKYFDEIPHSDLMQCIARRIVDRHILRLIKLWLKSPIVCDDSKGGGTRIKGGRKNNRGTPQGGVMTPRTQKVTCHFWPLDWFLCFRGGCQGD